MEVTKTRFLGLDLLRGIAALAVLVLHLPWPDQHSPMPRAYLAVDLFFVLSGFVIAYSYESRLSSRWLVKQYCLARLIRLYPLYCVATLLAAAEMLAYTRIGSGSAPYVTISRTFSSLATAIAFLPTPPNLSVEPSAMFPLAFPAWSLFWELIVNLIFGAAHGRPRRWLMISLMAIGLAGIVIAQSIYGAAGGTSWDGAWAGGARALFSFFAGVTVFRLSSRNRAPALPILVLALPVVVVFGANGPGGAAYDITCITLIFPMLVWLGANAVVGPRLAKGAAFLGALSYPLYILQAPLLLLSVRIDRFIGASGYPAVLFDAVVILTGSWLAGRWFDAPVRRWLSAKFIMRLPQPPAETAP